VHYPSPFAICILATGLLVPNLAGWYGFSELVEAYRRDQGIARPADGLEEPPSSIKTPNPSYAPAHFIGPIEAVVYVNPYWAALGRLWFVPGWIAAAAALAWTALRTPGPAPVAAVSLSAGLLLAAPWIYAIAHLLAR
jgi:hypothetical protein